MPFAFQNLPAAGYVIQALCWTLIHSLWQSLIAAVVAGCIIVITKKSSSSLRYTLLTLLFFVCMAVSSGTFIRLLYQSEQQAATGNVTQQRYISSGSSQVTFFPPGRGTANAKVTLPEQTPPPLSARIEKFCNDHAFSIVSFWMIFLMVKLWRTGISLNYIRRIRRYKTSAAPDYWSDRILELAASLGMQTPIQLLESGLITVPMVIGFIKPVILVPLGILTELPPDQLEAVLLHELAHIRRKDYLVNLIQNFAEALFFFNPALLWISSLIREERENCCDDVAIGATRSKSQLIHALVAFQEYGDRIPAFALAFPGRKTHLLDRVKRIVYNRNKTLNAMEKTLLAACLLTAGTLTVAFSPLNPHRSLSHLETAIARLANRDTVPPVAPVPPVSPAIAPAAPVTDFAAPVVAAPVPNAAVPSVPAQFAQLAPLPVAPVTNIIMPVAPITNIAMPVAPIAPRAAIDTMPVPPPLPRLRISSDELQGGTFRGSLKADGDVIEYARGILTKDNTTKYFLGTNLVVQTNGVTTALYINSKRIPNDQLGNYKLQVDAIIDQLDAESKRQARAYAQDYAASSAAEGRGYVASNNGGDVIIRGKGVSGRAQSITIGKGDSALTVTSITDNGTTEDVLITTTVSGDGSSNTSGGGNVNATSYSVDSVRAYSTLGYNNTITDGNRPILDAILEEHLASDTKELSFSLTYHHFIINGVHQSDEVFNRFRDRYVKGKKDSYNYIRKDGSITSTIGESTSN